MNLEYIKPQKFGSLLMKSSQSNFNLQFRGSYSDRSYLIATVMMKQFEIQLSVVFKELECFLKNWNGSYIR